MNDDKPASNRAFANDHLTVAHLQKSLTVSHLAQAINNTGPNNAGPNTQGTIGATGQVSANTQQPNATRGPANQSNQPGSAPRGDKA